jgi:Zn-dependent peptidase ImmA (M78 family)
LTYIEIGRKAQETREKYKFGGQIPVPIELLVEKAGLGITPIPGIKQSYSIEGSLSYEQREIIVDRGVMDHYANRYRFTLAHELGHYILHGDYIRGLVIDTSEMWRDVVQNLSKLDYAMMEKQAHSFAGQILVPGDELEAAWQHAVQLGLENDLDLLAMGSSAIYSASPLLA